MTTATEQQSPPLPEPGAGSDRTRRRLGDRIFSGIATTAGLTILVALLAVFLFLASEGWTGLTASSVVYSPFTSFGSYIWPLLVSTVLASAVALILAVPFALAIALFVSHYAPRVIAVPFAYVIDLLAAVPSVVFGLWGGLYLAPYLVPSQAWLHQHFGWLPFFGPGPPTPNGRSLFTAGVVLAIMILPIITALSREVFAQTPRLHEEAALALGATRWEVVRYAVLPYGRSGVVSAIMLGLGRALGETMAVAMILAVTPNMTLNIIGTASPATIAANIALNYKEATPERQSLLIATGLVLFLMTFLVNFAARWILGRSERRMAR
jgi:phosphate transport system permease protein